MNEDEIIRIARECGVEPHRIYGGLVIHHSNGGWINIENLLQRFATLVAAAEREACADIADQNSSCEGIAQRIAAAIRARGQQ